MQIKKYIQRVLRNLPFCVSETIRLLSSTINLFAEKSEPLIWRCAQYTAPV
jgi:hypothetical protein